MRKSKFSHKLIPIVLSVMIIFSSLPISLVHAEQNGDENLATVEAITSSANATYGEDQTHLDVEYGGEFALDWYPAIPTIGRIYDGWWIGVRLYAPEAYNQDIDALKNSKLIMKPYGKDWSEDDLEFWKVQDSPINDKTDVKRFVDLWVYLDETILETENNKENSLVTNEFKFDWDNDGTYEQDMTVSIKPDEVKLLNKVGGENIQVYPYEAMGTVTPYDASCEMVSSGKGTEEEPLTVSYKDSVTLQWSEANPDIGRTIDSWWTGLKIAAPIGRSIHSLNKSQFKYLAYGKEKWTKAMSFWDAQDSDSNNANTIDRFAYMWMPVDKEMIAEAKAAGTTIDYEFLFDWEGDGIFEQKIIFAMDPDKIELDTTNLYAADHTDPVVTDIEYYRNSQKNTHISNRGEYTITFNASDERSGLKEWGYSTINSVDTVENWSKDFSEGALSFKTTLTDDPSESIYNTTYFIFVRDNAGNVKGYKTINESNGVILDNEAPVITSATPDKTEKTNQKITYTLVAEDDITKKENIKFGTASSEGITDIGKITWLSGNTVEVQTDQPIYVYALDETELNLSEVFSFKAENFNDKANSIQSFNIVEGNDQTWNNQPVKVQVIPGDSIVNASGETFAVVQYAMDSTETWVDDPVFSVEDRAEHKFYVKDEAGNISEPATYNNNFFDGRVAELDNSDEQKAVVFERNSNENNDIKKALNILSFGLFFNEEWNVVIHAIDNEDILNGASGVKAISLKAYDTENALVGSYTAQLNADGTQATVSIPLNELDNFKGNFKVVIEDNAGNVSSPIPVTTSNSNVDADSFSFMIENSKPEITDVVSQSSGSEPSDSVRNQSDDFSLLFKTNDKKEETLVSGIGYVGVTVNNEIVFEDRLFEGSSIVENDDYKIDFDVINSKKVKINNTEIDVEDGALNIEINVYDNAGNANTVTQTVYLDAQAPSIISIERVKGEGESETLDMLTAAVAGTEFALFYNADENNSVTYKITAKEYEEEGNYWQSGLKSITYTLYDAEGNEIEGKSETKAVDENGAIEFTLEAGFKGYVAVTAADNLDNQSEQAHTKGIVYETKEQHIGATAFEYKANDSELTDKTAKSDFSFSKEIAGAEKYNSEKFANTPLYSEETTFTVTATSDFAGIKSVELYEQKFNDKNSVNAQAELINLPLESSEWSEVKDDNNLVVQKSAQLKYNNFVDTTFVVVTTDNAGYKTYDYYTFTVDTEAPIIQSVTPDTDSDIGIVNKNVVTYTVEATDKLTDVVLWSSIDTKKVNPDEVDLDEIMQNLDPKQMIWKQGKTETTSSFSISDCYVHIVFARDEAGNISAQKLQYKRYNDVCPTINSVDGWPDKWTNKDVIVTVNADSVTNTAQESFAIKYYAMDNTNVWQEEPTFTIRDCKTHVFYIKDTSGNTSAYTVNKNKELVKVEPQEYNTWNYDVNLPDLVASDETNKAVTFEQENASSFAHLLNKLTFGRFFNERLVIKVKANDLQTGDENGVISNVSGIVKATFKFIGLNKDKVITFSANKINTKNEDTAIEFEVKDGDLPEGFKGTAQVILVDAAGNEKTIDITTANSNMGEGEGSSFMIENTAPVVNSINEVKDGSFTSSSFGINIKATDPGSNQSGVNSLQVIANKKEVYREFDISKHNDLGQAVSATEIERELTVKVTKNGSMTVNGVDVDWNDGRIELQAQVIDNAGNVSKVKEYVIYIDRTAPIITKFEFSRESSTTEDQKATPQDFVANTVEATEYGFYFKDNVAVTISAFDDRFVQKDKNGEIILQEGIASGVKSITYKLVPKGKDFASVEEITVDVDENGSITVDILKEFKGQIYAYATDTFGNNPNNVDKINQFNPSTKTDYRKGNKIDENGYVHPEGTIVESAQLHQETSSIEFSDKNTKILKTYQADSNYHFYHARFSDIPTDQEMNQDQYINSTNRTPLYSFDPTINIKVKDSYSGIAQVEVWAAPKSIKTNKVVNIKKIDSLIIDNELTEDNKAVLTKNGTKYINSSEDKETDTLWSVAFEKDTNLVNAVARDFTANDFGELDENDYTLVVVLTDRAGNRSYDYYTFGVDKTKPQISVKWNTDSSVKTYNNQPYFNVGRYATVTIKDKNINNIDYIEKLLSNNGVGSNKPGISARYTFIDNNWVEHQKDEQQKFNPLIKGVAISSAATRSEKVDKTDGNYIYTFNVNCKVDGDYILNFACKDNSGNKTIFERDTKNNIHFTVDTTAPTVTYSINNTNVKNSKYFNSSRTATIVLKERNINVDDLTQCVDLSGLKETLNGKAIGDLSINWAKDKKNNTYTGTINFEKDGDYVVDLKFTDFTNRSVAVNSTNTSIVSGTAPLDFTIDKTAPTIKINIDNNKSYKNNVGIVVTESDNNCSTITTTLNSTTYQKGKGIQNGEVRKTLGQSSDHQNQLVYKYEIIEKDGYYVVVASCVDMAGNRSGTEKKVFTKNEFGSVYNYSKDLQQILKTGYVKQEALKNAKLYVEEYNPDSFKPKYFTMTFGSDDFDMNDYKTEHLSNGLYKCTYTIDMKSFVSTDGKYDFNFASSGIGKNKKSDKDYAFSFIIDNTKPALTVKVLDGENDLNRTIQTKGYTSYSDVLKLSLTLNDKNGFSSIRYVVLEDDGNGYVKVFKEETLKIKKGQQLYDILIDLPSSPNKRNIKIFAKDIADNEWEFAENLNFDNSLAGNDKFIFAEEQGIFVSNNVLEQVKHWIQTNVFQTILIGLGIVLVIAAAILIPIFVKRRKNEEDEPVTEEYDNEDDE